MQLKNGRMSPPPDEGVLASVVVLKIFFTSSRCTWTCLAHSISLAQRGHSQPANLHGTPSLVASTFLCWTETEDVLVRSHHNRGGWMNDPARRRAVAEEIEPHHSNFQPRQKDEPANSNSEHVRSTNPGSHLSLVLSSSHYHYRRQLVVIGQFGFVMRGVPDRCRTG
jgi:hypothetical protein